ncbi:MAG: Lpg1974 family pore-forming outer membrane protein, partial [Gemmataceae bacterium]
LSLGMGSATAWGQVMPPPSRAASSPTPVAETPTGGIKDLTPPDLFRTVRHEAPAAGGSGHATGHAEAGGHGPEMGHGPVGGDLIPPHHAHGHEAGGLFGSAEYLLMRSRREGNTIALRDSNRDLVPTGSLESVKDSLRSGFRAELGYRIPGGHWDILTGYTYYKTTGKADISAPAGGTLYPTWTRPGLVDEALRAQANTELEYNAYDIQLGRSFHIEEHFHGRVFGGGRFVSLRQELDVLYDGRDANNARTRTRSKFDGFGPIVGGEASLSLFHGFHAYARTTAGLLTGRMENPLMETNNGGATTYADLSYSTRRVVPLFGVGVGGGWQSGRVSVRVGYEMTNYFGIQEQPRLTNDFSEGKLATKRSDVSLEGLFVQFGLSY